MVAWDSGRPLGPNISVADQVFKRGVLRIILSDLDEGPKQTSLCIKVSCCTSEMSVIIMGAEQSRCTDFVT